MNKDDLILFRKRITKLFELLGTDKRRPILTEEISRANARRSLVSKRLIKTGNKIKHEDITWKRPGTGISPAKIESVVGKKVRQDIPNDSILSWDMFD